MTPMDPTAMAFLLAENRSQPMHVGALQLFEPAGDPGEDRPREMYEGMSAAEPDIRPLFLKHPYRAWRTGGQFFWRHDEQFDIEHHVRLSALPQPGRIRELLDLCGRLHSTRLFWERPLWEAHIIEGLNDGRVGLYVKAHHALMDGVSAMRLLQSVLSSDPDRRGMCAPWMRPGPGGSTESAAELDVPREGAQDALLKALGVASEAAGLPAALIRTLGKGLRSQTSAISLGAPRTLFNQRITGSRRVAAQDWPLERINGVAKAADATINDVVLAMCSGAVRQFLLELDALPDQPMVAMVPVAIQAKHAELAADEGGNAIGAVMCRLGTELGDPADRLATIHRSMEDGKAALSSMTPLQILVMSALGLAPAILPPMLRMSGLPPLFNLVISNVPGARETQYWNGAKLVGNYPLSIPIHGMALNITCTSYASQMAFGLTGCRRSVPHLQRLLTHLDDELAALEKAVGVA